MAAATTAESESNKTSGSGSSEGKRGWRAHDQRKHHQNQPAPPPPSKFQIAFDCLSLFLPSVSFYDSLRLPLPPWLFLFLSPHLYRHQRFKSHSSACLCSCPQSLFMTPFVCLSLPGCFYLSLPTLPPSKFQIAFICLSLFLPSVSFYDSLRLPLPPWLFLSLYSPPDISTYLTYVLLSLRLPYVLSGSLRLPCSLSRACTLYLSLPYISLTW